MNRLIKLIIILILNISVRVYGHGRMLDPPARGSMWRAGFNNVPANYNDMSNNCGGYLYQWEKNGGKCGVCGDPYDSNPRDHEPGGMYATGVIGKTYEEGQEINVTIEMTANHFGFFEFRLCKNDESMKKVEQECFDQNFIIVKNNYDENSEAKSQNQADAKYKFFLPNVKLNKKFFVLIQLPDGVYCKNCILQWRYKAGNQFGQTEDGKACLGCSDKQEQILNCADIEIKQKTRQDNLNNTLNTLSANLTSQTTPIYNSSYILNNSNNSHLFIFAFILVILFFKF